MLNFIKTKMMLVLCTLLLTSVPAFAQDISEQAGVENLTHLLDFVPSLHSSNIYQPIKKFAQDSLNPNSLEVPKPQMPQDFYRFINEYSVAISISAILILMILFLPI